MTRWHEVRDLFEASVALDPDERAQFLRERADTDASVVRQVDALLRADDNASLLDGSATEWLEAMRATTQPPTELCGQSFGAYRVEQHVADGGMAHVYRATRTIAGTQRRVALKVVRHHADAPSLAARFANERQALASLEHEHIVSFLDAGALPDGRPFLAMEFVDGQPLTTWARTRSKTARVHMLWRVALAVHHAHGQLIVHRDLKPSNVLVTTQGAPKLLDFGIATLLQDEPAHAPVADAWTPAFASPEQLRGEPASTSDDVYSLGALLRELLHDDPAAPLRDAELATVVQCACADVPTQRYGSAFEFAEDLRRYLANEPLRARPPSLPYRLRLFTRRHRWSLLFAAGLLAALLTGWVSAELHRRAAEREASTGWGAHSQARTAAQLYERSLVAIASRTPALGDLMLAELERAVREDLTDLPETETLVRLTLAQFYFDHGERMRAVEHAERAWRLAQTTRGIGRRDRERAAKLRQQAK